MLSLTKTEAVNFIDLKKKKKSSNTIGYKEGRVRKSYLDSEESYPDKFDPSVNGSLHF